MRLLVLGGSRFVGRALAAEGVRRGWDVDVVNRGRSGAVPAGVRHHQADRTVPGDLAGALAEQILAGGWDLAVDTWSGAPAVATQAARTLAGAVGAYGYVSSISVYEWRSHVDESSPLVAGDPDAGASDYAADKRGAELGVLASFPGAVLGRAGMILGPHEDVGRLPWWLTRIARGGPVIAPGDPDRPLQYIDARDLADWLLDHLAAGGTGAVDLASPSGHATTSTLLSACRSATGSDARFVWTDEATLERAGAQPWTHLPCWVPAGGEFAGFLEADTSLAADSGLRCRPVEATVADTWSWLAGCTDLGAEVPGLARHGLPPQIESRLLAGT